MIFSFVYVNFCGKWRCLKTTFISSSGSSSLTVSYLAANSFERRTIIDQRDISILKRKDSEDRKIPPGLIVKYTRLLHDHLP